MGKLYPEGGGLRLSDLSEGSEYYYSYLDVVNYSSACASTGGGIFSFNSLLGGSSGGGGRSGR